MTSPIVEAFERPRPITNQIAGQTAQGSGPAMSVHSPYDGRTIGELRVSTPADVETAVLGAQSAFLAWSRRPLRERIQPLLALRALLLEGLDDLSRTVAVESGKTPAEARAGILRGIEVIDFAASLQNSDAGSALDVSRGVSCEYRREPLGVVVGITPFNFPAMVPLWMLPLALTVGNAFILKPSEKVPLTAMRLGELALQAGYPDGVLSIVHGGRDTAQALIDHPLTQAVGFVGSSAAAHGVYQRAAAGGKRALCLGGAKNQMIVAPDADATLTAKAAVDSFTGCAGQRCMATSLLITVGDGERVIEAIRRRASGIRVGQDMGALIDDAAKSRIAAALAKATGDEGAELTLDGRNPPVPAPYRNGHWLGPCILERVQPSMECAQSELFGPVLSVIRVESLDDALAIEQAGRFGNATSIFTQSGAVARYVTERASSGMLGVNVGVPVPRDPFSFGGTKASRFGHGDMTGPAGVDFWTTRKKITIKWSVQTDGTWMS